MGEESKWLLVYHNNINWKSLIEPLTSSELMEPVRCGVCNQQHMAVQISKAPAESTEEEEEEDGRLY